MKRVLAVAVAALLVAAAIVIRDALDDDSADGDGGPDSRNDELVVACVTELRDACEALGSDVRIEDPAATMAAAAAGEIDAWITFDPWPAIAEVRDDVTFDGTPVGVATSDLVLLSRTAALPPSCGNEPDWACVAEVTGAAAPTLARAQTALGTLLLGHAAADWSATTRPGEPFAANEFELAEFQAWLRALRFSADPVADMIQLAPAGPVATGTTRATLETIVEPSREADALDATATDTPATVAIVVVGRGADDVAADDDFLAGLERLGWRLDPETTASTGLPDAGVLLALTQELV